MDHRQAQFFMDEFNDPLRNLIISNDDDDNGPSTARVLPPQRPSVLNEIMEFSFSNDVNRIADGEKPVQIKLIVDASPGCGGLAWPAGEVLSAYLAGKGRDSLCGKTVLELGSGTGLVGLVAASLGGRVWITDQVPLLDVMRRNVDLNNLSYAVSVEELNWGEPIPATIPARPDLLLAADCVYFEPAFSLLVQTLDDLSVADMKILFCYKKRRKADKRFFSLLKKKFTWEDVTDDPARADYAREGINLLLLRKK